MRRPTFPSMIGLIAGSGLLLALLTASVPVPELPEPDAAPATSPTPPRRADATPVARPQRLPPRAPQATPPADRPQPADPQALFEGDVPLGDLVDADRIERQARATERFAQAVAEGGYTAEQVDPAVRDFFRGITLEPILDDDGMIAALEVTDVERGGSARRAGFALGDRIDEIDGERLRDPADLPALMARLGSRPRICGTRRSHRFCRRPS